MGLPLVPLGNLEILFWVDPHQGVDNFGKTKQIQTFPIWPRTEVGILLQHLLRHLLEDGKEVFKFKFIFLGGGGIGYFF